MIMSVRVVTMFNLASCSCLHCRKVPRRCGEGTDRSMSTLFTYVVYFVKACICMHADICLPVLLTEERVRVCRDVIRVTPAAP